MRTKGAVKVTFTSCMLLCLIVVTWFFLQVTDPKYSKPPLLPALAKDRVAVVRAIPERDTELRHRPFQGTDVTSADFASTSPIDGGGELRSRSVSQLLLIQTVLNMKKRLSDFTVRDASGKNFLFNNFITPLTDVTTDDDYDVTVTTHCTSNHVHYVASISDRWQGPVSFAVFTYDTDLIQTIASILFYHLCFPSVSRYVRFHLAIPVNRKPQNSDILIDLAKSNFSCSHTPVSERKVVRNYQFEGNMLYPINLLRNLALKNANTSHVMFVDVDMLPSAGLRSNFLKLLHIKDSGLSFLEGLPYNSPRLVFILPVVEVKRGSGLPETKEQLLRLWDRKEAQPFNIAICPHCQAPTNYSRWVNLGHTGRLQAAYHVHYKFEFEPFVIAHSSVPVFDERFVSRGHNGISHMCELHVAGYHLVVLNNAFLTHDGFHDKQWADEPSDQSRMNGILYRSLQAELRVRYNETVRKCETSQKKMLTLPHKSIHMR